MRGVKVIKILMALVLSVCIWSGGYGGKGDGLSILWEQEGSRVSAAETTGKGKKGSPGDTSGKGGGPYKAPEFADAVFHEDKADDYGVVKLDVSAVNQGYVAVSCIADHRLKFQVMKDDATYNYDMESDGTPAVFPLQSGDGVYDFRIMENVVDTKYAELYSVSQDVKLDDEFQPFIRPSNYVKYDQNSNCVKKAQELAQDAGDTMGMVQAVYNYICDNVKYDKEKAKSIKKGYLPNPDETFASGKGICFDYAALAAAMLRSQGIPVKVIFGNVAPKDLYHAWNMFYTEETGWVTVKYEVKGNQWNRLDLTFAANGADGDFIGDGSNYTDVYSY